MKKKLITFCIFSFVLVLAFVTRFYKLGEAPAGLYLDEAGQGYSAYSLLKTGKDEFGKDFPIVFRSFTDFKTPVFVYLIVPLIPIFDLTRFTVRLPSFVFSMLTFPVLYFLIQHLAPKEYKTKLPLIVSLLLALSPWHILFGRTTFECNVALCFLLAGVLAFYKSLKKPILLIFAALLLALAIPSYHAQRVVTPLLGLVLFFRHRKVLFTKEYFKYIVLGALIGFLILLPTLSVATTPGFLARATGLNIFSQHRQKPAGYLETNSFSGPFINSSIFLSTTEFLSLYISYFSPRNMFILGDYGPRSSFPYIATFFIWQFPFYIYGLYLLIKKKGLGELRFFTLAFLLIAPLPAAVTRDPYSSIRALQMVIPLTIIIAIGVLGIWEKLKNKSQKNFALVGLIGIIAYSLLKLYSSVIILNEQYRGIHWNYGWQQAVETLKQEGTALPVVVDNSRDEPYIQLAFFLKYDPIKYQDENFEVSEKDYYTNMDRVKEKRIGNIITRPINWEEDLLVEQYLIGDHLAISDQQIKEHKLQLIEDIKYPDGSIAIRVVKTNPEL